MIPSKDRMKMTQMEGQVWISLYNLMMDEKCRKRYQWHHNRKVGPIYSSCFQFLVVYTLSAICIAVMVVFDDLFIVLIHYIIFAVGFCVESEEILQ